MALLCGRGKVAETGDWDGFGGDESDGVAANFFSCSFFIPFRLAG